MIPPTSNLRKRRTEYRFYVSRKWQYP